MARRPPAQTTTSAPAVRVPRAMAQLPPMIWAPSPSAVMWPPGPRRSARTPAGVSTTSAAPGSPVVSRPRSMARRSAAIWITVDGDRQSVASNDSSPAWAAGSVASASSAPTRSAWPRGSQVTATRASSRRRRASASLAFMVAPRGAERPPVTRRTVWPATCASSVRSSRRATGGSVPQRQRGHAGAGFRRRPASRPVRNRRIPVMARRLRYNSIVRIPAAAAALVSAVMLGGGLGADAAGQAPSRPAAAANPTPDAPPSAARQLQVAVDLAYNLDHEQAAAVLEQAMRDHPDDAALPRAHATLTWLNLLFT